MILLCVGTGLILTSVLLLIIAFLKAISTQFLIRSLAGHWTWGLIPPTPGQPSYIYLDLWPDSDKPEANKILFAATKLSPVLHKNHAALIDCADNRPFNPSYYRIYFADSSRAKTPALGVPTVNTRGTVKK